MMLWRIDWHSVTFAKTRGTTSRQSFAPRQKKSAKTVIIAIHAHSQTCGIRIARRQAYCAWPRRRRFCRRRRRRRHARQIDGISCDQASRRRRKGRRWSSRPHSLKFLNALTRNHFLRHPAKMVNITIKTTAERLLGRLRYIVCITRRPKFY